MPELAEVEITAQKLLPRLKGRRILDFWTDEPAGLKLATPAFVKLDIKGRKVWGVGRRGKAIWLGLSGKPQRVLAIHLRMSGRLNVVFAKAPRDKWTHFVWRLSGGKELRFSDPRKFGTVWYGSPQEINRRPYFANLGIDASEMSLKQFYELLSLRRGMIHPHTSRSVGVKSFLLNQKNIAGIGNIIADESLWRAKIHPHSLLQNLKETQIKNLYRAIKTTIKLMLRYGGTTMRNWGHPDGELGGYYERRLVYGRKGEKCLRCKRIFVKIKTAGRGTTICRQCQRLY